MSVGLMCDCPLPPIPGLRANDSGHAPRLDNKPGCPEYAEDQERGGPCRFCADAHRIAREYYALRSEHVHSAACHAGNCEGTDGE